ncbi:MAG: hypothetical protein MZW92_67135 [Comamonadaceae bacterium]|nr:hypothetical protein [Comamonadaceae bacterium]
MRSRNPSRSSGRRRGAPCRPPRPAKARGETSGEALTRINGIWKIRKGGIANDVVLRGFAGKDINVLIDGQRLYAGLSQPHGPVGLPHRFLRSRPRRGGQGALRHPEPGQPRRRPQRHHPERGTRCPRVPHPRVRRLRFLQSFGHVLPGQGAASPRSAVSRIDARGPSQTRRASRSPPTPTTCPASRIRRPSRLAPAGPR